MPVAQRLGWGRTQCDPLLLGEALPKIHTVGLSIPPAQNTFGGGTSLPYSTTPLNLRSPKPYYGQLTPKGPTWGVLFAPPHFGPMGKWPQIQKNWGVQFWESPFWAPGGHLTFFAVLVSWASSEHLDHPHTTDTQPIARKPTYLWAKLNWTRSLVSPSPTLGTIYTKETQPMDRESYTSSTLGETIPYTGVYPTSIVTPTPWS